MKRLIENKLIKWVHNINRKPLIINGARQVGKSWIVKQLGKEHFNNRFCELNFEKTPKLNSIFDKDFDIKRILQEIEILLDTQINSESLLFFDEVQYCPHALMSLRYFFEDMPNIAVIAAGSLLEFELKNISFPVGRVQQIEMYPMCFEEFLQAQGKDMLLKKLSEPIQEHSEIIEEKLYDELLNYYWVGGMPECVKHFAENKNYLEIRNIQNDLLHAYKQDFSKFNPVVDKNCLLDILNTVTNSVGNQIIYSKLSDRFTGPTIKKGVDVLTMAKLLYRIENVSVAGLPFMSSGKQFKIQYIDIGLLLAMNEVSFDNLFTKKDLNNLYIGSWAEQFVAQQLRCLHSNNLKYWARTNRNSNAEVDYVVEKDGNILPVEVKYGAVGKLKSLHILLSENVHINKAIVYSKAKYGVLHKIHFIPIYYAGRF